MQENAALIKEINELRRELHAARRARSSPIHRPGSAKTTPSPVMDPSRPSAAATAHSTPVPNGLASSSAAALPIGIASPELPDGISLSEEAANNAAIGVEDEQYAKFKYEGSTQFGLVAMGGTAVSSSDAFMAFPGPSRNGRGVNGTFLAPVAAHHVGMAADELASLCLDPGALLGREIAARDERIRQLEGIVAQGGECSLRQPPDMLGWSLAAIRSAGPSGSGPSS